MAYYERFSTQLESSLSAGVNPAGMNRGMKGQGGYLGYHQIVPQKPMGGSPEGASAEADLQAEEEEDEIAAEQGGGVATSSPFLIRWGGTDWQPEITDEDDDMEIESICEFTMEVQSEVGPSEANFHGQRFEVPHCGSFRGGGRPDSPHKLFAAAYWHPSPDTATTTTTTATTAGMGMNSSRSPRPPVFHWSEGRNSPEPQNSRNANIANSECCENNHGGAEQQLDQQTDTSPEPLRSPQTLSQSPGHEYLAMSRTASSDQFLSPLDAANCRNECDFSQTGSCTSPRMTEFHLFQPASSLFDGRFSPGFSERREIALGMISEPASADTTPCVSKAIENDSTMNGFFLANDDDRFGGPAESCQVVQQQQQQENPKSFGKCPTFPRDASCQKISRQASQYKDEAAAANHSLEGSATEGHPPSPPTTVPPRGSFSWGAAVAVHKVAEPNYGGSRTARSRAFTGSFWSAGDQVSCDSLAPAASDGQGTPRCPRMPAETGLTARRSTSTHQSSNRHSERQRHVSTPSNDESTMAYAYAQVGTLPLLPSRQHHVESNRYVDGQASPDLAPHWPSPQWETLGLASPMDGMLLDRIPPDGPPGVPDDRKHNNISEGIAPARMEETPDHSSYSSEVRNGARSGVRRNIVARLSDNRELTASRDQEPEVNKADEPAGVDLSSLCPQFTFQELAEACCGFAEENRCGQGTSGTVYLGMLDGITPVAIKLLSSTAENDGFEEEIRLLSMFRHPNLVTLLGFAVGDGRRAIVYEQLARGDLASLLYANENTAGNCNRYGSTSSPVLMWKERLSVVADAARGLAYLQTRRPRVFHRDIKTANILISDSGVGKIADFGLAALAKKSSPISLRVRRADGTPGYADPDYVKTLEVTEASEVYSFGMLLIEVLTSRPPAVYVGDNPPRLKFFHDSFDTEDYRSCLPHIDLAPQWPARLASMIMELSFRCITSNKDARPPFAKIEEQLRHFCRSSFDESYPMRSFSKNRVNAFAENNNVAPRGCHANEAAFGNAPVDPLPGVSPQGRARGRAESSFVCFDSDARGSKPSNPAKGGMAGHRNNSFAMLGVDLSQKRCSDDQHLRNRMARGSFVSGLPRAHSGAHFRHGNNNGGEAFRGVVAGCDSQEWEHPSAAQMNRRSFQGMQDPALPSDNGVPVWEWDRKRHSDRPSNGSRTSSMAPRFDGTPRPDAGRFELATWSEDQLSTFAYANGPCEFSVASLRYVKKHDSIMRWGFGQMQLCGSLLQGSPDIAYALTLRDITSAVDRVKRSLFAAATANELELRCFKFPRSNKVCPDNYDLYQVYINAAFHKLERLLAPEVKLPECVLQALSVRTVPLVTVPLGREQPIFDQAFRSSLPEIWAQAVSRHQVELEVAAVLLVIDCDVVNEWQEPNSQPFPPPVKADRYFGGPGMIFIGSRYLAHLSTYVPFARSKNSGTTVNGSSLKEGKTHVMRMNDTISLLGCPPCEISYWLSRASNGEEHDAFKKQFRMAQQQAAAGGSYANMLGLKFGADLPEVASLWQEIATNASAERL